MPWQSNVSAGARRLGALAVFVAVVFVLTGVAIGAGYWAVSALVVPSEGAAAPVRIGEYGACDDPSPWSCTAVPRRTIEQRFGQSIPDSWTVLRAEAEPVAPVSGTPQIQVLLEAPVGSDYSSWLAVVDDVHTTVGSQAPFLGDLGVTSARGGTRGFTKVYSGEHDSHIYLWAYKHM